MNFEKLANIVFDDSISLAKQKRGLIGISEGRAGELRRQASFAFRNETGVTTLNGTIQASIYPTGNCQLAAIAYINRFFGRVIPAEVEKDPRLLLEARLLLRKLLVVSTVSIFDNKYEIQTEAPVKPMVLVDYKANPTPFGDSNEATVNLLFGKENRVTFTPYPSTNGSAMILSIYRTDILRNVPLITLDAMGHPEEFSKAVQSYLSIATAQVPQPATVEANETQPTI